MPAFPYEPLGWTKAQYKGFVDATPLWHGDVRLVYGWEDDMEQEWSITARGPVTKAMTQDGEAIPWGVLRGDRTYIFKHVEYIETEVDYFSDSGADYYECMGCD